MAAVGLPIWTPDVWADTVWEDGVWRDESTPTTPTLPLRRDAQTVALLVGDTNTATLGRGTPRPVRWPGEQTGAMPLRREDL